jgi:hypothetical protein
MALYEHSLIFEGLGHGWQEAYNFEADTENLSVAYGRVIGLKDKRKYLLGADYYIKGERLSLLKNNAGVKVTRRTLVKKAYTPPPTLTNASEDSGTSLQVLFTNTTTGQKKLTFLGGVWRSIFPGGDSYAPAGSWQTYFNAWAEFMKAQGLGWLGQVPDLQANITGYTFSATTGKTTYTADAALGWVIGKPIRISVEFPLQRSPLDGVQVVIPLTETTAITAKARPASPYAGVPGTLKTYQLQFVTIGTPPGGQVPGTIEPQNPVGRKRGRPLLVSRGRQPNQVRW